MELKEIIAGTLAILVLTVAVGIAFIAFLLLIGLIMAFPPLGVVILVLVIAYLISRRDNYECEKCISDEQE